MRWGEGGKIFFESGGMFRSLSVWGFMRHGHRRTGKGGFRIPLCNPRSRPTKSAASPLPSAPSPRFRSGEIRHPAFLALRPGLLGPSMGLAPSGPTQALFKSAPGAFVHAGLTWLVDCASAILMPDQNPLALASVRIIFMRVTSVLLTLR